IATYHPVIGATWPVNSPGVVTGATTGPPVNGGQRWRSTTVNGCQRRRTTTVPPLDHHRSTTPDHRSTTVGPPANHRSTVVNRQSMVGQRWPRGNMWHHVAADVAAKVA
ncbi:hypothetical protein Tco_0443684, partial [Tanacetum coccineum]